MKFALLSGRRVEAQPKLRAICPACSGEVIAKCGQHIVWHWAHSSKLHCDPWWESETDWHREWKNRFPTEWQEVPMVDARTEELHIADVKTAENLVIEFQRSSIHPDEVRAREDFYVQMIWVVDGRKNDFDRINFSNMRGQPDGNGVVQFHWFGRSTLFNRWHTFRPVFIDFGPGYGFWRILRFDPKSKRGLAILCEISAFVAQTSSGETELILVGGPATT
jgi:hypothetical protein